MIDDDGTIVIYSKFEMFTKSEKTLVGHMI